MKLLLSIFCLLQSTILLAEQTVIRDYNDVRTNYFYDQLYTGEVGESLYCGKPRPLTDGGGRSLEHVMPAQWLADHFGCPDRNTCPNQTYKHAEGDLHNLWLAISSINKSRRDNVFGEIPEGEGEARFAYCPEFVCTYSPNPVRVEPRNVVKGNIARSLLYMHDEYGFDLKGMKTMLKRWNRLDPPCRT